MCQMIRPDELDKTVFSAISEACIEGKQLKGEADVCNLVLVGCRNQIGEEDVKASILRLINAGKIKWVSSLVINA